MTPDAKRRKGNETIGEGVVAELQAPRSLGQVQGPSNGLDNT